MPKRGLFITLEGPEGSGKTTQGRWLERELRRRGWAVVRTREPGGTAVAEGVRRILLTPEGRVSSLTELFLYEAARAQHVADVVRPALAKGAAVVCDRYTDATEAYQGWGRGLDRAVIRRLNDLATGGLCPDLTLLLDVPTSRGLRTARSRAAGADRIEREPDVFHQRVRRGYLAIARREPRRVRRIPWKEGVEVVQRHLTQILDDFLRKRC
jgi:dTMP kinase